MVALTQVEQVISGKDALVGAWFDRFSKALDRKDYDAIGNLVSDDCYWRDLLTFGWKFKSMHGISQITSWLETSFALDPAINLRLAGEVSEGSLGEVFGKTLETFFDFETSVAKGRGFLRLVVDPGAAAGARAVTILTSMRELRAFPERTKQNRPRITTIDIDEKTSDIEGPQTKADVVIVGAGQAGLMLAARLRQAGVKVINIDRSENVGDVWRQRYRSLKLHNETCINHFPYLSLPESWPVYLPRDKVVSWLEFYAKSMDLDIAANTTYVSGKFDHEEGCWNSLLRHVDGREYTLQSKHLVLAAGVCGAPKMPKIPGADRFPGTIVHSSAVNDTVDVKGKRVVVVGAGTSAHDIAQMSYVNGAAEVTMVQRSSVTVVSLEPSAGLPFGIYRNNDGVRNIDDTDLMYASVPFDLMRRLQVDMSKQMMQLDEKLIADLRKVGFLWDNGEDDSGFMMKVFRSQSGYYLNVGASDLIVEEKIKLKSGVEVSAFEGSLIRFSDGSTCEADFVVFATGYKPLEDTVERLFGHDVASLVGPIYGIGDDDELRNMYSRTAHPNFYVTGGGIAGSRSYSRYTALLIKAQLEGLVSFEPNADATLDLGSSKLAAAPRLVSHAR